MRSKLHDVSMKGTYCVGTLPNRAKENWYLEFNCNFVGSEIDYRAWYTPGRT